MSLKKTRLLAILYVTMMILLCAVSVWVLCDIYCRHTVSLIGSFTGQTNSDIAVSRFLSGETGSFSEGLIYLGKEGYSGNYSVLLASHLLPVIIILIFSAMISALFMFLLIRVNGRQSELLETEVISSLSSGTVPESLSARLGSALQENSRNLNFLENTRNAEQKKQNQYWQDILHQIKTPLSSLRICCENALDDPENCLSAVRRCLNYTLQINGTLNDALSLGNLEYGSFKPDMHEHTMSDLVEIIENELTDITEKKNIALLTDLQDGNIICDEYWLSQAIENIVKNAVEYSPSGESVSIACHKEPTLWHIVISDNGPGFGDEDPNISFDRYYFSNRKHSEARNHGLGLAISKQVVQIHYGRLWACNGESGGAEFHILLPFLDSDTLLPS